MSHDEPPDREPGPEATLQDVLMEDTYRSLVPQDVLMEDTYQRRDYYNKDRSRKHNLTIFKPVDLQRGRGGWISRR